MTKVSYRKKGFIWGLQFQKDKSPSPSCQGTSHGSRQAGAAALEQQLSAHITSTHGKQRASFWNGLRLPLEQWAAVKHLLKIY